MPVRSQARNVRSLADCSVKLRIMVILLNCSAELPK
jgi:hypothetical protein